ncbi:MAG: aminotransferase class V-fold PLP-dependent enzyme [Candidatus Latescibacterota bacterium]|nr:aminotransferase class V-fold PLP-dependent enzyme [Candidatus Latescibacterota bacterium]
MTRRVQPLLCPNAFTGLEEVTHLCTGGEAPWLREFDAVYAQFAELKSTGDRGREEIFAVGEQCRRQVGLLWGVEPCNIAFVPSAAEGMNWLARGLDWRAGDNVVTDNLEFPSVAYAWRNLRERGVEVRMVSHRDWHIHEADVVAAVDERTRVVAVSQVSFYTGQNLDLRELSTGLSRSAGDPLLAVDATHASGVIEVPAKLTDLCVSSSYKWMLATHGTAPCFVGKRAQQAVSDSCFGWHNLAVWPVQGAERAADVDVRPMPERLEPGNLAMLVVMFLECALRRSLEIGTSKIQEHARDLSEIAAQQLGALGLTVISPSERTARSGNTCFRARDARGVAEALADRGILVWGDYGRVRVSGHLYNGSCDIDRLSEALSEIRVETQ